MCGNNRNACFFCEEEYRYFLDRLREGLSRFRVALHAYVLMTNHVHLLMTPYRELFRAQIPEVDIYDIRECLTYNHPLGNDRSREQVESTLAKRVGRRQRGRPPKPVDAPR